MTPATPPSRRTVRTSPLWGALALALTGCVDGGLFDLTLDVGTCEVDADCKSVLGSLASCNAGFCDVAPVPTRCADTVPVDLFDNPEHVDRIVLTHLYDSDKQQLERNAVELAVTEANYEGGFQGRLFGLVHCDYGEGAYHDGLSPEEAATDVSQTMTDLLGVTPFVGPYESPVAQVVFKNLESDGGGFFVSPAASAASLTSIDGVDKTDTNPGTFWRTVPSDVLQGRAAAYDMLARVVGSSELVTEEPTDTGAGDTGAGDTGAGDTGVVAANIAEGNPIDHVAVVYARGNYGEGLAENFRQAFTAEGGTVDLQSFDGPTGLESAALAVAANRTIEEVFFIGDDAEDYAAFLGVMTAQDYFNSDGTTRRIMLPSNAATPQVLDAIQDYRTIFRFLRGTRPALDTSSSNSNYVSFAASFVREYGVDPEDSVITAYAYDATWLSMYASVWSQAHSNEIGLVGLGSGMRNVSDPGSPVVNLRPSEWNQGVGSFVNGESINAVGVSGNLDFDAVEEETTAPIQIWNILATGTKFNVLYTFDAEELAK